MDIYKIYALCEPDSEEVRYVGATKQRPRARLKQHLKEADREVGTSPKEIWLRELIARGLEPSVLLLEETEDSEREGYWISFCREIGFSILNELTLYEGLNFHSEEAKQKIAEASRRLWKEPWYRELMVKSNTGRKKSPEEIEKIRQFHLGKQWALGRKATEEERRAMSERQKGKPKSQESVEKIKAIRAQPEMIEKHRRACQARSSDPEYRHKLSEANKRRFEDPERLQAHREMCQRRSADPTYREKLKEAWKSRPRATHCKRGHSLEDVYLLSKGKRKCRKCCAEDYLKRKNKANKRDE